MRHKKCPDCRIKGPRCVTSKLLCLQYREHILTQTEAQQGRIEERRAKIAPLEKGLVQMYTRLEKLNKEYRAIRMLDHNPLEYLINDIGAHKELGAKIQELQNLEKYQGVHLSGYYPDIMQQGFVITLGPVEWIDTVTNCIEILLPHLKGLEWRKGIVSHRFRFMADENSVSVIEIVGERYYTLDYSGHREWNRLEHSSLVEAVHWATDKVRAENG